MSAYSSHFHSLLHASLPASFPAHMHRYLSHSLQNASFPAHPLPPTSLIPLAGPAAAIDGPHGQTQAQAASTRRTDPFAPSAQLNRLGFLTRYGATVMRVAFEEIERVAKEEADKGWEERRMGEARRRVAEGVGRWVEGIWDGLYWLWLLGASG